MKNLKIDNLEIFIASNRIEMGGLAASAFEKEALAILEKASTLRAVFASAPSQVEFLNTLLTHNILPWNKIEAFHMDEYVGVKPTSSESFAHFIYTMLWSKREFYKQHIIDGTLDTDIMIQKYTNLLKERPIDIVGLGIGENGHIAFNDPHVADFNDPFLMKEVLLDEKCRIQQVSDGCFPKFELVPEKALTLTIPTLFSAQSLICVVPGIRKAEAVHAALFGPVSEKCPASILRKHPNAKLFLDQESASMLS